MKKTVNDWMLNNTEYDNAILVDASGKERYIFLDTEKMYNAMVLKEEKVNCFTVRLYTNYTD